MMRAHVTLESKVSELFRCDVDSVAILYYRSVSSDRDDGKVLIPQLTARRLRDSGLLARTGRSGPDEICVIDRDVVVALGRLSESHLREIRERGRLLIEGPLVQAEDIEGGLFS